MSRPVLCNTQDSPDRCSMPMNTDRYDQNSGIDMKYLSIDWHWSTMIFLIGIDRHWAIIESCNATLDCPEGMVQTFTHEEPSSFGTLESEISPSWEPIEIIVIVFVFNPQSADS